LLVLFGLRQITQMLCALPQPAGLIWPEEGPGFPSLLVTYQVANDFFFSGHTAIAVFGAIELGRFVRGRLGGIAACTAQAVICLAATFLVTVVLLLRAHYTMDVFAGRDRGGAGGHSSQPHHSRLRCGTKQYRVRTS
jgi:hypothetical protein